MIHLLALLGALSISFSAVFVRLASVSPVTATFYRAAYALPVLAALWIAGRSGDRRSSRERWLAAASGLSLAVDLDLWHESIALIGAGLGTVIPNTQVVFVALLGWLVYGERPTLRTGGLIVVILGGLALASGLGRQDAYGANPVVGVALGVAAGLCYAAFILMFRASNRVRAPSAGPLLDATLGMAIGAVFSIPFDPHFAWTPTWPAHAWLALMALVSQVIGWMLISRALQQLPVVETSLMLMVQPVLAMLWGLALFDERLSGLQWLGSAIVLASVSTMAARRRVSCIT
ncbi:MAG: DMT family transporter [Vicinamibacterales bacterium]